MAETHELLGDGAGEIDMLINVGRLRGGDSAYVQDEIAAVVDAAGNVIVKAILETAYLDREQKILGCQLAEAAGAAFVKTSTGFAARGATAADVALMRESVSAHVSVKAAGGVRDLDTVLELLDAGAVRFGSTSTGVILHELAIRHAR